MAALMNTVPRIDGCAKPDDMSEEEFLAIVIEVAQREPHPGADATVWHVSQATLRALYDAAWANGQNAGERRGP